jgi:hypothetical protein
MNQQARGDRSIGGTAALFTGKCPKVFRAERRIAKSVPWVGTGMAKLVVKKLAGPKAGSKAVGVTQKRIRDANTGQFLTVRTIDGQSKTPGQDLNYVFARNVAKARRDNKAVTGMLDRAPEKA